ncbi:hypothetical protein [Corynebacterium sp. Marseille-P3884]|uniref:hypothetical protein n=1 Tax=Corynebacterium sp. Marseille-P3884 TaxID=2495409 RepID=UPI001B324959|nr:hypothetical protein [Corynebacterium sp. Marseille-P3884]MBP3949434.1 hypothetical protein [Corynebacterium sp. Marseille-P3884]
MKHGQHLLTVDGEQFRVRQSGRFKCHYDWLTGANPGYGFAGGTYPPSTLTDEDHIEAIRDFLADIDPNTGYLSED